MSIGYINGKFVSLDEQVIPIDERGHQFGDGVYEVIRFYNGKGFMLDEHLDRLEKSAQAIKLNLSDGISPIRELIFEGVKKAKLADCYVYLQITRGIAARNHLFPSVPVSVSMTVKPASSLKKELVEEGAPVIIHPDERWANCYIKSLNLLPNILAKQTASEKGCYEAVLVKDGHVTEGTSSNIFIVKGNTVVTTPLTKQILPGITRMAVKQVCEAEDITFQESHFSEAELLKADEVFLTSTTSEVLPVTKVDGVPICGGKPGKLTQHILTSFKKRTG
ncbi:D-amino-acid transaminase [Alteribacter populi]|uniref:D-amino-acid transaminase n=1 Tax=Alteribacter populi TaxID=2011011 RepID=UPI000BBAFEDC|nr:D-amino-acid transaminase [Alteribacter populi]